MLILFTRKRQYPIVYITNNGTEIVAKYRTLSVFSKKTLTKIDKTNVIVAAATATITFCSMIPPSSKSKIIIDIMYVANKIIKSHDKLFSIFLNIFSFVTNKKVSYVTEDRRNSFNNT